MAEYVDREAVLKALNEIPFAEDHHGMAVRIGKCHAENVVRSFPAADVAPVVHEKWIIGDGDDDFDVKCPVCGWSDVFDVCGIETVKDIAAEMHYCQNCGAKMDLVV